MSPHQSIENTENMSRQKVCKIKETRQNAGNAILTVRLTHVTAKPCRHTGVHTRLGESPEEFQSTLQLKQKLPGDEKGDRCFDMLSLHHAKPDVVSRSAPSKKSNEPMSLENVTIHFGNQVLPKTKIGLRQGLQI